MNKFCKCEKPNIYVNYVAHGMSTLRQYYEKGIDEGNIDDADVVLIGCRKCKNISTSKDDCENAFEIWKALYDKEGFEYGYKIKGKKV